MSGFYSTMLGRRVSSFNRPFCVWTLFANVRSESEATPASQLFWFCLHPSKLYRYWFLISSYAMAGIAPSMWMLLSPPREGSSIYVAYALRTTERLFPRVKIFIYIYSIIINLFNYINMNI